MFLAEAHSCSVIWLHGSLGSQHTTHTFCPECATKPQNVFWNLNCMSWLTVLPYIPCSVHSRRHSLACKYWISRTLDCIGFKHLIFKIAVWVAAFCLIFLIIEYIWAWEDFPSNFWKGPKHVSTISHYVFMQSTVLGIFDHNIKIWSILKISVEDFLHSTVTITSQDYVKTNAWIHIWSMQIYFNLQ